jgi:outer membrane protein assembly factor BamB
MTIKKKQMSVALAVALTLLLAATFIIEMPITSGALTSPQKTYAFISVKPKTVGLNQQLLVNSWIYPLAFSPTPFLFQDLTVTFTKPDGTTDTFKPQEGQTGTAYDLTSAYKPGQSELVGALYFYYVPDKVGTWSVKLNFPEQKLNLGTYDCTFLASTSQTVNFVVQQDPVTIGQPAAPLPPPDYQLQFPISGENREWYQISGGWLQSAYRGDLQRATYFNPYSTGPNTAHVLWTNQPYLGGLVGGPWGSISYGMSQSGINPPLIMNGRVYYNMAGNTFRCVDLQTGQILWNATGQLTLANNILPLPAAATPEQTATLAPTPSLWNLASTGWVQYDPLTGTVLRTITNVPAGLGNIKWDEGYYDVYMVQCTGWNTTLPYKWAVNNFIRWNINNVTNNNWLTGIVWNVTLRQSDGQAPGDDRRASPVPYTIGNEVGAITSYNEQISLGFNLTTGKQIWRAFYEQENLNLNRMGTDPNGPLIYLTSDLRYHAIDIRTGQELWVSEPTPTDSPWGSTGHYMYVIAYGNMYIGTLDGHVYALNIANGQWLWKSDYAGDTTENPWSTWGFFSHRWVAADGKIYVPTGEHSPSQPLERGTKLFCVDAFTGKFLWNVSGFFLPDALAYGNMLALNMYDGLLYSFAKGPSATTVSVPQTSVPLGSNVLIQGSVKDQSPAQPNTPAVSDDSMTEWMNYMRMQNATLINSPPTPKGVQVTLTAIDSTGTVSTVGTVTTSANGNYATMWTPPAQGVYRIVANFAGTESYYSSKAETALGVGAAATTANDVANQVVSQLPTPTPAPAVTSTDMAIIAAVIIAILIGIVNLMLLLRRKTA